MRAIDPEDPDDMLRLWAASESSYKKTQDACAGRLKLLDRMVGPYYAGRDTKDKDRRPVNMIDLGVDIFQRGLASHQPQARIETDFEDLLPVASDFETVLNRRIRKMKLKDAMNICAVEALFTMGVMCVGIGIDGEDDPGEVFAEPVLFPDLILDMAAKSWVTQSYIGHDFLVPLDWLEGNEDLDAGPRDEFIKYCRGNTNSKGRDWDQGDTEDFEDLVKLRQLYLPRRKKIVLFAVEGPTRKPLMVSDWTGPDCGPYIPLAFRTVPGKILPLAPVPMWYDLDDFTNKAYTKAFRQSDRCKTIGLALEADDAAAIQSAEDGEIKGIKDPQSVVEKTFGGANKNVVDAANMAQRLLVYVGGNWDALGGLAPSSGTVGQDQLLTQGAGGRMKDMQQTMVEFETEVINSIAFWEWQKPIGEERFTKRLAGTKYGLSDEVWSPENRSGDFFDLNLSANPYANVKRSPTEQAAFITQFLEQVILPSIPYMQQDGPIDWEMFYKLMARLNNAPEIEMLLNWPGGDSIPQSMPDQPKMPSNTKRTYERVNTQGGSQNPLEAAMSQFSQSAGQSAPAAEMLAG